MTQDHPPIRYWRSPVSVGRQASGGRGACDLRLMGLRSFAFLAALVLAVCAFHAMARAELTGMSEDEHVVTKDVSGQVVMVRKRALSIETSRTGSESAEMLIPVNVDTKLEHLKALTDLKEGDTVTVQYQQTSRDEHDQQVVLKTVATRVSLVKEASPEGTLRSANQVTVE